MVSEKILFCYNKSTAEKKIFIKSLFSSAEQNLTSLVCSALLRQALYFAQGES
jgi:hypothetical protein